MTSDLSLLAARLALGLGYASHGAQKAFGWFDGPGPQGTAKFLESLGFKPGEEYGALASYGELTAGTLIALGLGGPIGPAILLSGMLVSETTVKAKNGFFAGRNGVEVGVLYAAGALALAGSGYGDLSLDRVLGWDENLRNPLFTALALAGGLAAGYAALGQRDMSPPDGTLATPTVPGNRASNGAPSGSKPSPAAS
jgi:putative oxidoreductase